VYQKVGTHVIKGTSIPLGHPPIAVLYNCDAAYYRQVRAEVGDDCIICFRVDNGVTQNVVEATRHPRAVLQSINEPVIHTPEEARRLCDGELSRMQFVRELGGHYCLFSFAVGNPADLSLWQYLMPAIDAMEPGDYVGLHAYWGIDPTNTWHVARWQHVPELRDVPIIVTEGGRDVVEGQGFPGWKGHVNREQYLEEIETVNGIMESFPNVHGYALYTLGTENDPRWRNFAIDDIWPSIRYTQVPTYLPPVEPPSAEARWPMRGNWRITQRFGDNPALYPGMTAHNGIDMVSDDPGVYSMSNGYLYQGCDPSGYGHYAYIVGNGRAWVYAHLAHCADSGWVKAGDKIGTMGYSGRTIPCGERGTHLHVGMREVDGDGKPLHYANGFKGYEDWLP